MKLTTLMIAMTLPLTVLADDDDSQRQNQSQNQQQYYHAEQSAIGTGNTTEISSQHKEAASGAYAPGGVIGKCLAAYGIGFQSRGFGFSFGGNKARKVCEERELALLLITVGEDEKGRNILYAHYQDWQRNRRPTYVCKLPTDKHCVNINEVNTDRAGN